MGFYSPAVLIKDAQRHGLRVRPIDVLRSDWLCTLEDMKGTSSNSFEEPSGVEVLRGHGLQVAHELS